MSEYSDADGYPTTALAHVFQNASCGRELLDAAAEYFTASGYGSVEVDGPVYRFVTRGWSGCEEIVDGLMSNVFSGRLWESSHRGGLHVFDASNDITPEASP